MRPTILILSSIALVLSAPALAQSAKTGDLTMEDMAIRATLPNQTVASGYLTIRNDGSTADRLLGGTASFASDVEIHRMDVADGVMRMRQVGGGVEIPAGGSVSLIPGGEHLMFTELDEPLKVDETRGVTLRFEKAGDVPVTFVVEGMAALRERFSEGAESSDVSEGMMMPVDGMEHGSRHR